MAISADVDLAMWRRAAQEAEHVVDAWRCYGLGSEWLEKSLRSLAAALRRVPEDVVPLPPPPTPTMLDFADTVSLTQTKCALSAYLRVGSTEPRVDVEWCAELERMLVSARYKILAEPLPLDPVTYPATWWDAVLVRWAPRWVLRRWPARMCRVRTDAWALYPYISMPHEAHTLTMFRHPPYQVDY